MYKTKTWSARIEVNYCDLNQDLSNYIDSWLHTNLVAMSSAQNGHVLRIVEWTLGSISILGFANKPVVQIRVCADVFLPEIGEKYEAQVLDMKSNFCLYKIPHSIVWVEGSANHEKTATVNIVPQTIRYDNGQFLVVAKRLPC